MKNVKEVLDLMLKIHPEYKDQLQEAISAYEFPLSLFKEREAKWRLADMLGIDTTIDTFEEMQDEIVIAFDKSDYFIDGEVIEQIVEEIVTNYQLVIQDRGDLHKLNGAKNPFIYLLDSNVEIIAHAVCEMHSCDSLKIYDEFVMKLKSFESDYISLNDLKNMYKESC